LPPTLSAAPLVREKTPLEDWVGEAMSPFWMPLNHSRRAGSSQEVKTYEEDSLPFTPTFGVNRSQRWQVLGVLGKIPGYLQCNLMGAPRNNGPRLLHQKSIFHRLGERVRLKGKN